MATKVPKQLSSHVSPTPGREKDTTRRREKTEAEQRHQHSCPELSRSREVDTVALVSRTGGTREAGEAAELVAEKEVFQGGRNEGEAEVGLDQWRPLGTGGCRGGEEKIAERSVVWDQRDMEDMRERINASRKKTLKYVSLMNTLKEKKIVMDKDGETPIPNKTVI